MSLASAIRYYRVREERSNAGVASVIAASDFATGFEPRFARACSARGEVVEIIRREDCETYDGFVARAASLAAARTAPRLLVGGLDPAFDPNAVSEAVAPSKGAIVLPEGTGLHPGAGEDGAGHPRHQEGGGPRRPAVGQVGASDRARRRRGDEGTAGRLLLAPVQNRRAGVRRPGVHARAADRVEEPRRRRDQALDRRHDRRVVYRDARPFSPAAENMRSR